MFEGLGRRRGRRSCGEGRGVDPATAQPPLLPSNAWRHRQNPTLLIRSVRMNGVRTLFDGALRSLQWLRFLVFEFTIMLIITELVTVNNDCVQSTRWYPHGQPDTNAMQYIHEVSTKISVQKINSQICFISYFIAKTIKCGY